MTKETLHIANGKVHPCHHCSLACTQQYYVLAPSLDFPDREVKMYLCLFCAHAFIDSGIQIRKVTEST